MYFMEAHDGLSALIAQRSGFRALWASGLAISTAIGLRDASEICASEMLKVVERMAEVTTVPILVDVDAGYGNFNNLRLIARRLATYGVAGICVEDKLHPKLNSYCEAAHNLAEMEELCGRLRAVRDDQGPDGVVIVARTETLIAGRPMDEALERAKAYSEAGADAILIHSKRQDAEEVIEFAARWRGELPLLAVPTTYYRTSAKVLQQAGVADTLLRPTAPSCTQGGSGHCNQQPHGPAPIKQSTVVGAAFRGAASRGRTAGANVPSVGR
jgi:phosphoenolpyruvate phosphomutase